MTLPEHPFISVKETHQKSPVEAQLNPFPLHSLTYVTNNHLWYKWGHLEVHRSLARNRCVITWTSMRLSGKCMISCRRDQPNSHCFTTRTDITLLPISVSVYYPSRYRYVTHIGIGFVSHNSQLNTGLTLTLPLSIKYWAMDLIKASKKYQEY